MKNFKRKLKEFPKKTMYLFMTFAMLLNFVLPVTTVFATGSYTITFQAEGTHTMMVDGGHLKIDGQFVDLKNNDVTIGNVNCTSTTSCSITASSDLPGVLNYNSANQFTLYNTVGHVEYNMGSAINSDTVFMVEDYSAQSQYEDIDFDFSFTGTTGMVQINGNNVGDEGASWSGTASNAGYADNSNKNEITIITSFGEPVASKITINGVEYDTNGTDFNTVEVDGATSYTIAVESDSSIVTPKTIIWTNPDYVPIDEEDAAWASQFSIGHGYARAVEVYDDNNQLLDPSAYINTTEQPDGSKSDEYGVRNGFGWIKVMPGYKVVFEFVPEYGYQLTGITINGEPLDATNVMNRFEFTMPNASGNVQFGATFSKTEDIVKANSEKVASGNIELGNELGGGSAQLTVNDVELSSDKISEFKNAAGDYTISNYLDIDLYNVFYKGKNDANDVWSNKISELDEYATITIKLADGIDANDIVIVHNIHDGDEYEVIQIESYDPKTNTITFKTKSFSNYAIATKTSSANNNSTKTTTATTSNTTNPQTGDNITTYFITLLLSIAGLTGASLIVKNRRKFAKN